MGMGKIIGAVLGFMLARQVGALLGFILGHLFDLEMQRKQRQAAGGAVSIQEVFFRTTFEVMGHVAKSDGRVSAEEIRAARAVMSDFRLQEADISRAIEFFT